MLKNSKAFSGFSANDIAKEPGRFGGWVLAPTGKSIRHL
jgi:hypothetical protein